MSEREMAGVAVWDFAISKSQDVAVYAPTQLIYDAGGCQKDGAWATSFRRVAFNLLLVPERDYQVEYGRFEPCSSSLFVKMCNRCLGNPHWPALVAPLDIADSDAAALAIRFNALSEQLSSRDIHGVPVNPVLSDIDIPTEWLYSLWCLTESFTTYFLCRTNCILQQLSYHIHDHSVHVGIKEEWRQ